MGGRCQCGWTLWALEICNGKKAGRSWEKNRGGLKIRFKLGLEIEKDTKFEPVDAEGQVFTFDN